MNEAVGLTARVRVLPLDRMARCACVALDVHLNDGGLVNEAIDGGERHGGGRRNKSPPIRKRVVSHVTITDPHHFLFEHRLKYRRSVRARSSLRLLRSAKPGP